MNGLCLCIARNTLDITMPLIYGLLDVCLRYVHVSEMGLAIHCAIMLAVDWYLGNPVWSKLLLSRQVKLIVMGDYV